MMSEKTRDAHKEDFEDSQPGVLRTILSDWIFLAVLGVLTALLSATTDTIVVWFQQIHELSIEATNGTNFILMYTIWIIFFTLMVVTSSALAHYFAPQAVGSGVPEMKTILRGAILKDYLTFRTLLTKVISLIFSLGSGTPIGKMGPFVHISSLLANQLWIFVARFDRTFRSDARRIETLTAACAIGVACVFSAPIGGVLFSIEVTTTYFSVRNYWRGFFGACCGAITFRLLNRVFDETPVTTSAFFQTHFPKDPFSVDELPLFALLGLICGLLAACFIKIYKHLVLFLRTNRFAKNVFQKRWLLYPVIVSVFLGGISFPPGLGRFFFGHLRFNKNLQDFYLNCTFSADLGSATSCDEALDCPFVDGKFHSIIMVALYVLSLFLLAILSQSLPIPCGIFMPTIVLGAAIGRLVGEITSQLWPNGLDENHFVFPGVYAVAGSSAFCGAVTRSLSVSVVVFEATGQLHCLLPSLIAVIISNALSTYLQPSFFDTIIKIKHLPFLPDIPLSSNVHAMTAEKLMTTPVRFLCKTTKYEEIKRILTEKSQLKMFPVVDGEATQMLFGTVSRGTLLDILEEQIGDASRQRETERRASKTITTIGDLGNSVRISMENQSTTKLSSVDHYSNINCRNFMMEHMKQAKKVIFNGKTQNEILDCALHELNGREAWEHERLNETFLFTEEFVDPASFQIARRTTLSEIHSLFSMCKLTKSYVTEYGRLIGVVALFDVRQVLENAHKNRIELKNDRKPSLHEKKSEIEEALKDVLTPAIEVLSPRRKSRVNFSNGDTAGPKRSTRRRTITDSAKEIDDHLGAIPEHRRHTLAVNQSENFVTGIRSLLQNHRMCTSRK